MQGKGERERRGRVKREEPEAETISEHRGRKSEEGGERDGRIETEAETEAETGKERAREEGKNDWSNI